MSTHVPLALRRLVAARANGLCEYCLLHESDGYFSFQVEHIIAEKHNGATSSENLAYACVTCNLSKGTDIASISRKTGQLVRLFNPRADRWLDHFALKES
jgi:5-methylcytosine-specific restriction endonuclease McrA